MLVPEPEGQEFELGHSQFRNRKAGRSAKSATDTVDLTVAKLGDGRCVLKELVVVEGGGYLVREAKNLSIKFDKVGSVVGVSSHCGRCQWSQADANLIARSCRLLLCS